MKILIKILIALLPVAVAAAAPTRQDFAAGMDLQIEADRPIQALELPDAVYAGVLRADLADLRVFNAGDVPVPHALCALPAPVEPGIQDVPLRLFLLEKAAHGDRPHTRVDVQTAGDTRVVVEESGAPRTAAPAPQAYVIDATATGQPLRALRLDWQSADGASEVTVRVEASEDLDAWRTLVPSTTLLRSTAAGETLERARIDLPTGRYRYLRLERTDGNPPPQINEAIAEAQRAAATPRDPRRFAAMPMADDPQRPAEFLFDAGHLAPVERTWVQLPLRNMSLHVALDTRRDAAAPWTPRWSGDVNSLEGAAAAGASLAATADRWWRLRVLRGAETLAGARPALELGYFPARLVFFAQGALPFVLAYGSARAAPATPQPCPSAEEMKMSGLAAATRAPAARFGGADVLTPLPPPKPPTPWQRILLWSVLLAGVAALIAMAVSLLKRLRPVPGDDAP